MATISIEIPDEILESFNNVDEVRKVVYEDFVIEQRQNGNISLGRAAELLDVTYSEFFDLIGKKGLSFINTPKEDIEDSYHDFEKTMEKFKKW